MEVLDKANREIMTSLIQHTIATASDSEPPSTVGLPAEADRDDGEAASADEMTQTQRAKENRKRMILNGTSLTRMTGEHTRHTGMTEVSECTYATSNTLHTGSTRVSNNDDRRALLGLPPRKSPISSRGARMRASSSFDELSQALIAEKPCHGNINEAMQQFTPGQHIRAGDLINQLGKPKHGE